MLLVYYLASNLVNVLMVRIPRLRRRHSPLYSQVSLWSMCYIQIPERMLHGICDISAPCQPSRIFHSKSVEYSNILLIPRHLSSALILDIPVVAWTTLSWVPRMSISRLSSCELSHKTIESSSPMPDHAIIVSIWGTYIRAMVMNSKTKRAGLWRVSTGKQFLKVHKVLPGKRTIKIDNALNRAVAAIPVQLGQTNQDSTHIWAKSILQTQTGVGVASLLQYIDCSSSTFALTCCS
jgi:hypothetical protein